MQVHTTSATERGSAAFSRITWQWRPESAGILTPHQQASSPRRLWASVPRVPHGATIAESTP